MFLSSGGRYIREILELPQGWQGPFKAQEGRCDYSRDAQQKRASSGVEGRISWFFSSCTRKLEVPLELRCGPQGPDCVASVKPVSIRVVRGLSEFLSNRCWVLCPHLELRPASSFLSSADKDLGVPMEFPQGSQASSRVETFKYTFHSSCNNSVRLPVELT